MFDIAAYMFVLCPVRFQSESNFSYGGCLQFKFGIAGQSPRE